MDTCVHLVQGDVQCGENTAKHVGAGGAGVVFQASQGQ